MRIALWISGTLCLLFPIGFWSSPQGIRDLERRAGGAMQLDLRLGHTPEQAAQLLDLYGQAGIARFRGMLWVDMMFPAVYAAFFASIGLDAAQNFDMHGVGPRRCWWLAQSAPRFALMPRPRFALMPRMSPLLAVAQVWPSG